MLLLAICCNSFKTTVTAITAFGTIADDTTKSGQALTIFHKKLSDIISDIQTSGLKNGLSGIFGNGKISLINDGDIDRVNEYFSLIDNGIDKNTALQSSLKGASSATKQIAITSSSAADAQQAMASAVKEVTIAEKAATIGTKALSVGLNLLTNIGISIAISAIVKSIEYLATAEERAAEKNREFVESVRESIDEYKKEEEFIQGVINKYTELYSSTNDITSIKRDLLSLQDEIVDKYGEEANAIDLINGKYSDNIKLLNQERLTKADDFLRENEMNIREAENRDKNIESSVYSYVAKNGSEEQKLYENYLKEYGGLRNEVEGDSYTTYHLIIEGLDSQIQFLQMQADILAKNKSSVKSEYDKILKKLKDLTDIRDTDSELLGKAEYYRRIKSEIEIPDDVRSKFNSLIDQAKELNQTIQGDGTVTERYAASQELESLKNEIYQVADANTVLKNEANTVFAAFETGASNAITSTAELEKEFYESLDDVQKGSLKNVELIENAMQTLANGKYVPWKDFFDIKKLDTDDMLSIPTKIGNELNMDAKELQQLKDAYIKPIIESLQEENQSIQDQIDSTNGVVNGLKDQLEYELLILDAKIAQGVNSSGDEKRLNDQKQKIQEIRDKIKGYGDQIKRNNLLIEMWNTHLGNTIDKTEMLNEQMKKMQDTADNYAKAMTAKIDSVIDSHESEKDVLEKEKEVLNGQLDTLEEQQKTIEDIIDDYKSIVDIVGDVTDKEIDLLKKQQEVEENAVQAKIDALKEAREQQEEENTLTEKQLALQEKLRDLEKARQTKVRTYSSERGWHFDVDKEAVANAQTAVDDAQADYDKAVDDKAYNDQLSSLEKEKDLISKNFEEQIKAYEDYYDEWKAILDEQTEAENEQIAQQILGAEWREKIKNKDTDVLNKFKSNFQGYNTQLNNLINTEIANLKLSIKAKEDEIKAKEKQIQSWKDYKTQVENSINSIKGKYEDYVEFLGKIEISENSSYEDREKALANFVSNYQGYINEIQSIQAQLSDISVNLTLDTNFDEVRWKTAEFLTQYRDGILAMDEALRSSSTGFGVVNSGWDEELANAAKYARSINFYDIMGCAQGGVVDYTGLTMLHGEKQRPEVVFNAAQSKQLYDMVMKGEFADLAAARAAEGFTSVLKSIESAHTFNKNINNTNNSNTSSIVIQHMDVNGVQNPAEFTNEFNKNMKQYLQNVYIESLVQ